MSANEQTLSKKNRKWLKISAIVLSISIVLGGAGYGIYYFVSNRQLEPAPNFSVTTLSSQNFTLSDYLGKVVLLDFMSVTCAPCIELMPELNEFNSDFNGSLVILSIDVDPSDTEFQLQNFRTTYNGTWEFALDTDNLQDKYGVLQIPKTVIIDKEGYITFSETGLQAGGSKLRETIEATIAGTARRIFTITFGVSIGAAFGAGFLSFFSPCAFPLLPGYMAYNLDLMVREDQKEKSDQDGDEKKKERTFGQKLWKSFVWGSASGLGIFIFYMIIGVIISILVLALDRGLESLDKLTVASEYIQLGVGILLIILGILSFTPLSLDLSKTINKIEIKSQERREKRLKRRMTRKGIEVSAELKEREIRKWLPQMTQLFIYGFTYALASIGCSLPILLGLMLTAIEAGTFAKAIIIFLVYSLVMALLMIVITILVGFSKDALINKLQASTKFVKILTGILLILAGGFLMGYFLWNHFKV